MKPLLSRKSYREVARLLDHYKKQHLADRLENQSAIPAAWGIPLRMMIESVVRKNHERWYKELPDRVLEYLADRGLLVRYAGDYTFPTGEYLPTEQQIRNYANSLL